MLTFQIINFNWCSLGDITSSSKVSHNLIITTIENNYSTIYAALKFKLTLSLYNHHNNGFIALE